MTTQKLPIHKLPLPAATLQRSLPKLDLDDVPSSQRRSTTFKSSTSGVWARVLPMWTAWPLRLTKAEVEEMGIDMERGEQVDVEDVLRRWDLTEESNQDGDQANGTESAGGNGLKLMTSPFRNKLEAQLIGLSPAAIKDSLPHLDIGDASKICNEGASPLEDSNVESSSRRSLTDVLSGRKVIVSKRQVPKKAEAVDEEEGQHGTPQGAAGEEPEYGPWSTRYCGHQFGVWAGQLGDGRAISILETEDPSGQRQEIQLKGAGRTPFSRQADGLAVMRSGVREFLGCEAIAALGIPTTRSLALLTTPQLPVYREHGPEPPSLLARLAPTFIRIGHFEALNPGKAGQMRQVFFGGNWGGEEEPEEEGPLGGQGNLEGLRDLAEWCKKIMGFEGKSTANWVRDVVKRNAEMVAGWQVYGFMHGVLNSDNISIMGLTIDYGPYAFMDVYDENHICNHSDPTGLYSYKRQPERVLFDLNKLVSSLSPLIGYEAVQGPASAGWSEGKTEEDVKSWDEKAEELMEGWKQGYIDTLRDSQRAGWLKRFGLKTFRDSDDREIITDYLSILHAHSLDFHKSFRHLSTFTSSKASDSSYLDTFAVEMITESTASGTLSVEEIDKAKADIANWLAIYEKRVSEEEEIKAWQSHSSEANGNAGEGEEWEMIRQKAMKGVNPRFVLRQWVLEDVIDQIQEAGMEGIADARKALARVLDMSCRPFEDWNDESTAEGRTRAALCGIGKREMLGFQCSCSS